MQSMQFNDISTGLDAIALVDSANWHGGWDYRAGARFIVELFDPLTGKKSSQLPTASWLVPNSDRITWNSMSPHF